MAKISRKSIKPIIQYRGGKRRIAPLLSKIIRDNLSEDGTYYEPFVGGGAVFLDLCHNKTVIGDINPDLINMYECVRDDYQLVVEKYKRLNNNEKLYYQVREMDRRPTFERADRFFRAARLIYLSKTCFGALEYNSYGQVSQGYCHLPERPYYAPEKDMFRMSELLKTAEIYEQSYEGTIENAKAGDVVYLDPPYMDTGHCIYWNDNLNFSIEELKTHCDKMNKRGVKFILQHSESEYTKKLYKDYNIYPLKVFRDIDFNKKGNARYANEYIITNIDCSGYFKTIEN